MLGSSISCRATCGIEIRGCDAGHPGQTNKSGNEPPRVLSSLPPLGEREHDESKPTTTHSRMSHSSEVRECAIRLMREPCDADEAKLDTIFSIAEKTGCTAEPLRLWVR